MKCSYDSLSVIKNSRFIKLFESITPQSQNNILKKIDGFINESTYNDQKNYAHLCNIFSSMAIYIELMCKGKTKEKALESIGNTMYCFVENRKREIQKKSCSPLFIPLLKIMGTRVLGSSNGIGWELEYPKCATNEFYFTVKKCIYYNIFKQYNLYELGPLFCHVDDIVYGELPNISFSYTQTICRDGNCCDYKFSRII